MSAPAPASSVSQAFWIPERSELSVGSSAAASLPTVIVSAPPPVEIEVGPAIDSTRTVSAPLPVKIVVEATSAVVAVRAHDGERVAAVAEPDPERGEPV